MPSVGSMALEFAYSRIAREIEREIRSGRIPPGGKLMGEREMAAHYGVSSDTARRAVRELREKGLVETLRPLGSFVVQEIPPADPAE